MTTSSASSSSSIHLFSNPDIFLKFADIEDLKESTALLTYSMQFLPGKIATLNRRINSLAVDGVQPYNKKLENSVPID